MPAKLYQSELTTERLAKCHAFPHTVEAVEVLETHISWIVLTGEFAYKIKKPVKFDFVDYSTIAQRRYFCEKEIELNRRFAPDLYLGVVQIIFDEERLTFSDVLASSRTAIDENVVDHAVKMRQFPQSAIVAARVGATSGGGLSQRFTCASGKPNANGHDGQLGQPFHKVTPQLTSEPVEQFGRDLAAFHGSIEAAHANLPSAQPSRIRIDAIDNFDCLIEQLFDANRRRSLRKLQKWTEQEFTKLKPKFGQRLARGYIRRCHGDLHLKNIIKCNERLFPFDGIEFSEALLCIDITSEIAFPTMDFAARGRSDLCWVLYSVWLEATGDFDGIDLFRFYAVYRAMVRAKVTWLNPNSHGVPQKSLSGPWDRYIDVANYFAFNLKPSIAITHGFSGSGKSTSAMRVIEDAGGLRIRSDVERTRIASTLDSAEKYSKSMSHRVYRRLLALAGQGVAAGLPVVIDAAFLMRGQREQFHSLARELGVAFSILDCTADYQELCRRIRNRKGDASEATIKVLNQQLRDHEPLTDAEQKFVVPERNGCR